jgi:hypothetical protein
MDAHSPTELVKPSHPERIAASRVCQLGLDPNVRDGIETLKDLTSVTVKIPATAAD